MPIIAKNLVIGAPKEEPKAPPAENSWNNLHYKLEQLAKEAERERIKSERLASEVKRNIPYEHKVEEKHHYEIVKEGDLVKHHNLKSSYLNDMTGFKN